MSSSKGSVGAWIALGASALFLAVAIAYRVRTAAPAAPPAAPAPVAPVPAAAAPSKGASEPRTEEGRTARRIAQRLSASRGEAERIRASGVPAAAGEKEQAASAERETQDLARSLGESLHKNPTSWPEVLDLASTTEDLKVALRLGALLGEALDATAEPLVMARVTRHAVPRMRQVAATALAAGKTRESLTALIDAADQDSDAGVRLAAVTSLAQRRLGSSAETQLSIESALRRRAQADGDEYIRQVSKNLVEPQPLPNTSKPPMASKKFPVVPPEAPKK